MPIGRRNPKSKVILAGIQGLIIGVVGVLLFGFILNLSNGEKVVSKGGTAKITSNGRWEGRSDRLSLNLHLKQNNMACSPPKKVPLILWGTAGYSGCKYCSSGGAVFCVDDLFVSELNSAQSDALPSFTKTLYVSD